MLTPFELFAVTGSCVVNRKREPFDVDIGRPGKWGNPYVIGQHGTRQEVLAKYKQHISVRGDLLQALLELRGKRLGCWCAPLPCHGDILLELLYAKVLELRDVSGRCP